MGISGKAHQPQANPEPGRRAAVSAATNIAEGSAKRGSREFRRFLDMSIGSLSELSYLLRLSWKLGYLSETA